jgi:hypothetical protein
MEHLHLAQYPCTYDHVLQGLRQLLFHSRWTHMPAFPQLISFAFPQTNDEDRRLLWSCLRGRSVEDTMVAGASSFVS